MKDGKVPTPIDVTLKLMKVGNFKLELMVRSFLYQCNTIPNLAHAMAVLAKFIVCS